jgi:hypothetical protein
MLVKKDSYFVVLDYDKRIDTLCARVNYCFKQKFSTGFIDIYNDLRRMRNSNTSLTFDRREKLFDWRYATQEEINEYERLGHPYNVETIKQKKKKKKII